MTICKRRSDGALFKACRPKPDEYEKYGSPFECNFFFRGIRRVGWKWFGYWKETGEIWKFSDHREFDVIHRGDI